VIYLTKINNIHSRAQTSSRTKGMKHNILFATMDFEYLFKRH